MEFINHHFVNAGLLLCIAVLIFHIYDLRKKLKQQSFIIQRLHLQERSQLAELETRPQETLNKQESLFVRICQYMDDEKPYTELDFKPENLAKALATNRTYLAHAIKIYAGGLTINQFITRYRLRYASQLLENNLSSFTLTEIAEKAGFSSRSTFNRLFVQFFGVSPSCYEEMLSRQRAGETPSL